MVVVVLACLVWACRHPERKNASFRKFEQALVCPFSAQGAPCLHDLFDASGKCHALTSVFSNETGKHIDPDCSWHTNNEIQRLQ